MQNLHIDMYINQNPSNLQMHRKKLKNILQLPEVMHKSVFCFILFPLGQLQIAESEESDQGKYECVAKNEVGSQYSYSAQLYVRGK